MLIGLAIAFAIAHQIYMAIKVPFAWNLEEAKPARISKFASCPHETKTRSFRGDFVSLIIVLNIYYQHY